MQSKNVLLIIPEMATGGAQRSLSKLSLALSQSHHVTVATFNKDVPAYPVGGSIISLNVKTGPGLIRKSIAFFQRVIRLRKIKLQLNIHVSISFLEGSDYINLLSRVHDKVVLSIRGSKIYDETMVGKFHWLRHRVLIPILYPMADAIVTVNKGIAKELKDVYQLAKPKTMTIGNFYDIKAIQEMAKDEKSRPMQNLYSRRVLVTTGRLAPEKGLHELLRVFRLLKEIENEIAMVIVGDGPLYRSLLDECQKLGLRTASSTSFDVMPDVVFTGSQTNVFKFLAGASLYLMNSSSEGFPNGLVEAMICGVPVVTADCPYGPREILAPDCPFHQSTTKPLFSDYGVLMPAIRNEMDRKVWTDTLAGLLREKQKLNTIVFNALNRIRSFDKQSVMDSWNQLIQTI